MARASGILTARQPEVPPLRPNPSIFQIDVRDWLYRCSQELDRLCQLDEIPDLYLDRIAGLGFDWIWLLGIWQTGPAGAEISRQTPEWQAGFHQALPDLTEDDITGSTFAITEYEVHADFGGPYALRILRDRLRRRGLRVLLDFVPNHTAIDHPWVEAHPDFYVHGGESDLEQQPKNFIKLDLGSETAILAHGRDPYFPGWPDTMQLNYGNPEVQEAMTEQLVYIAGQCDAVRCDMAMLVLPDVFARTWGIHIEPFWAGAIAAARVANPEFRFVAEVYWGLQGELQQLGFDYTYDKDLYDHLVKHDAGSVRAHLSGDVSYQHKLVRFLENHDEPRAAATFSDEAHKAAAVITYFTPGLRFFHAGQLRGVRIKPSIHLRRRYPEPANPGLFAFYTRLLECLKLDSWPDDWTLLEAAPAWDGNWTNNCFLCFGWSSNGELEALAAVNFSDHRSQCYVKLPFPALCEHGITLRDLLSDARYQRSGSELFSSGLYLDMPNWQFHLFKIEHAS
ncbi:MAG: alpha-amylase family glycosyl hydrolase [Bryobacteraceae bacterium]